MAESKSVTGQPGPKPRFEQYQYDMLKRCSIATDITEWNNWRGDNPKSTVQLQGADFSSAHLEGADFMDAHLQGARLGRAHLKGANFTKACAKGVYFVDGCLESAKFIGTDLKEAHFQYARLKSAKLIGANLERVDFSSAHLESTRLDNSNLKRANLADAKLYGASLLKAIVDGETLIWDCAVDERTNFTGVALDAAQVQPALKPLLEYNIRRLGWQKWYGDHSFLRWPVELFWLVSDYGRLTVRIITVFFLLSFLFGGIYYFVGLAFPPGIVTNLFETSSGPVAPWLVPFRAFYFSVVTMTTLGFGDMYANAHSLPGHILLTLQVILGYVLLGALITRLAVLFTAGGPAGEMEMHKTSWKHFQQMARIDLRILHRRIRRKCPAIFKQ